MNSRRIAQIVLAGAFLTGLVSGPVVGRDYPIRPVPFTEVKIADDFWAPRIETNRTVTIPYAFGKCEETGRIDNFLLAAGKIEGEHKGDFPFDDTDPYKILEGAAYVLNVQPDPELDKYLDDLIAKIAAAQEPDGYLYTCRTNNCERLRNWFGNERWEKLADSHELYNMGHLYEAAAAHFQATGKRNLLDIALKNAGLLDSVFGPGRNEDAPGHQVIEMGLVKLYRATGDEKYLNLAKFFLDTRGPGGNPYNQSHEKPYDQSEAVGHAVRAAYMYSGMADVAAMTGDERYLEAIDRIWDDVVFKKLYLTGGIGATGHGEAFGGPYELPNETAYCETCAAIGNVYWNHRMFLFHGDARYIDVMERTLYNGVISGVSLEQPVLLSQPTGLARPTRAEPLVRLRLLPGQRRPLHRLGAGLRLRSDRRRAVREPLRPGPGDNQAGRPDHLRVAGDRLPLERQDQTDRQSRARRPIRGLPSHSRLGPGPAGAERSVPLHTAGRAQRRIDRGRQETGCGD